MRLFSLALLLLVSTPSIDGLTPREREAFEYLRDVEQFQMPTIGFASQYSGGYLATRILARSPRAEVAFRELLREGKLAGQLYALAALQRVDPSYFREVAPRYRSMKDEVMVFEGCIINRQSVRELMTRLDSFVAPPRDEEEARKAEREFKFKR